MSDGARHGLISLILAPFAFLAALAFCDLPHALTVALSCSVLGVVVSPDLDLPGLTLAETVWKRLPFPFGQLLSGFWYTLWLPYATLLRHRGVSHWPLLGTLTRIVYLALWWCGVSLAVWLAGGGNMLRVPLYYADWIVCAAAGLAVSDAAHWATDVILSAVKRYCKRDATKAVGRIYE